MRSEIFAKATFSRSGKCPCFDNSGRVRTDVKTVGKAANIGRTQVITTYIVQMPLVSMMMT